MVISLPLWVMLLALAADLEDQELARQSTIEQQFQ
ncbi:hypothetical protein HK44_013870 [Pseudomonas fluorescens HK44]|uniref:Uncharacterized protein n=1 Tax=Pseudomonas fluorescens HK44 TaxID=1042209 RepID=A0A010SGH0_PSEFL|nr:hypothetical protein HK44_013870 [Pseudomonas fluorescens HK44]